MKKIFYLILHYILLNRLQITKFIIVGFTTFFIYLSSFHVSYNTLHLNYKIAATIAYIITIISHFLLNRLFTFKAKEQNVTYHVSKYLLMLLINYIDMLIIVWFIVDILKSSPYLGIVASTGVSAFVSFFIMKYFVFHHRIQSI